MDPAEMNDIECFWCETTGREARYLRRYARDEAQPCPGPWGYHNAKVRIEDGDDERGGDGYRLAPTDADVDSFHLDPRWPTHCECGYEFTPEDHWQVFTAAIYSAVDGRGEWPMGEMPLGAMWDAFWMGDSHKGPDGRAITVRLPGDHDWCIDGRASNCTRPDDMTHQCWVRRGDPPKLTVDKQGDTCDAGAGSIWIDQPNGWHGFLRDGRLVR